MTKFHHGLLVGFFLGSLFMGVAVGIIRLYLEERREKYIRAREQSEREFKDDVGSLPYADPQPPEEDFSFQYLEEPGAKRTPTTYYLHVIIE